MKVALAVLAMTGVACGGGEAQQQVLDPGQSEFSVDRTSAVVHEVVTATIVVRDTDGEPVPGIQVTLVTTGTLNDVLQPNLTDASGAASGTWTTARAEIKSIAAMLPDSSTLGSHEVTFVAGPPTTLVFETQPVDVEAGEPMGVEVAYHDADGNIALGMQVVGIDLGANPPATMLHGPLQSMPASGVASFSGLHVDVPGTSYSLIASATGFPDVESDPFDVAAGAPVQAMSSMTASPYSNDADGIAAAQITVSVRNQYNVPIAGVGAAISVTGTGNLLGAASVTTTAAGTAGTTLKSTTAETKVVSANIGPFTLTAPVKFFPPACIAMLPNRPSVPFDATVKAMVSADLDGDGSVDVADVEQITQSPPHQSQVVIRRGRGDGRFQPGVTIPIAGAVAALAAGDLDGDGDLDLVATITDQSIAYVLMQSTGTMFSAPMPTTLGGAANALALADLNEDGDLDMVASLVDIDRVALHLGTGTGTFGAGALLAVGDHPISVTTADFNLDGNFDIGVSQFNDGSYSTFLGNGDGTFGMRRTKGAVRAGSQIVADVDHDLIPDVIVASTQSDGVDVLLGNGDGTFRYEWGISSGVAAPSIALANLDADTHPDLVLASSPTLLVLSGTGTGEFTPTNRYATSSWGAQNGLRGGLALADVDSNGILDAITAGNGLDVIAGLGNGMFVAPSLQGTPGVLHPVDADFNGDGRSDLAAYGDQSHYLLLGGTDGTLAPSAPFTDGDQSSLLRAGDVNADGHKDVVIRGSNVFGMQNALRVGLGTGTGTFSFGPNIANILAGERIVLAKIDADSHVDLILIDGGDAQRGLNFSLGNGAGSFGAFNATVPKISTASDPRDLAIADLDKDGALDLVVAERQQLATYTNDGNGNFVAKGYAIPDLGFLDGLSAVTVGDFDGDTFLDVAVGHDEGRIHVFRGVTGGAFDPVPERYELQSTSFAKNVDAIDTRDVDGDGTLDLLIVGTSGAWLSQGFGNGDFRPPRLYNIPRGSALTAASEYVLGDRNADGRVDLVLSTRAGIAVARQGLCKPWVP
jgi:hypothetical protein